MKKTFTMIELLIVVAIIGLLLTLLMPSLAKAKDAARKVVCASNLAQCGRAISSYVRDYDQYMPASTGPGKRNDYGELRKGGNRSHYKYFLMPYLDLNPKKKSSRSAEVFTCPSSRLEDAGIDKEYNGGLAYNREFGELFFGRYDGFGNNHGGVIKLNYIEQPAESLSMADTIDWATNEKQVRCIFRPTYSSMVNVGDRHSKGINVLWVDTTVRWASQISLRSGRNNDVDYFYKLIKD